MGNHVGAQAFAQPCEYAEDATPYGYERDVFPSLIGVAQGKQDRLTDDAKNQGRQALDDLADHIEERPVSSVLIAFGVGILLGRLFDR